MTVLIQQDQRLLQLICGFDASLAVTKIVGASTINHSFHFLIEFVSNHLHLQAQDVIGETATLVIKNFDTSYIHGYIQQLMVKQYDSKNKRRYYEIEIKPWFDLLKYSSDCQIFQELTVIEIFKSICKKHQFSDYVIQLKKTYPKLIYCTQYNETNFEFLSRILNNHGIYYYFKQEKHRHLMVLIDDTKSLPHYQKPIEYSNSVLKVPHLHQLHAVQKLTVSQVSHTDYNYLTPHKNFTSTKKRQEKNPLFDQFQYPGNFFDQIDSEKILQQRETVHSWQSHLYFAQANVAGLSPGMLCQIHANDNKALSGDYWIYHVEYQAHDFTALHEAIDEANTNQTTQHFLQILQLVPTRFDFQPERIAKPSIKGVETAIGTGVADEEIYTDAYGRIKVQFHWDRYGSYNENSSCWLRVAQHFTGDHLGHQIIPRIGQEVLVDFINGDPDRPQVIGTLTNSNHLPPFPLPQNQHCNGYQSHSFHQNDAMAANILQMDDSPQNPALNFIAQHNYQVLSKNNQQTTIENQALIQAKGNQHYASLQASFTLASKTAIHLQSGTGQIHISPDKISIHGAQVNLAAPPATDQAALWQAELMKWTGRVLFLAGLPLDDIGIGEADQAAATELIEAGGADEEEIAGYKLKKHAKERMIERNVKKEDIENAVKSPLKKKDIKYGNDGKISQRYIGKKAEVVINSENRKIISVNPTDSAKLRRILRYLEKEENKSWK